MKRKIFALMLAVLMVATMSFSAAADAYIPPEEPVYGYNILTAHEKNGTCKPLNTFLSNFVEMGLDSYYLDTSDEVAIACVLKHIEMNAGYYTANVSSFTGDDGTTYMTIRGSFFEERMQRLFGRNISAQACPGYEDGYITVSADHFGGPIQVIANVNSCYEAGGLYEVFFDVYFIHTDFSGWYTTAYYNLPMDNLTCLGSGRAIVGYAGGQTLDTISTAHFSLVEWQMDARGIAEPGDNLPYGYVEETLPPETEPPTEVPTQAPTEATNPPTEQPKPDTHTNDDPANQKDDPDATSTIGFGDIIPLILIIALVCLSVLLAAVILLVIALKKKKK